MLIPSNRIAPVAANAFASLNKLAPGRIVFGVSTGFTGRRTMGLGAVKLADMEEYIRIVQALWRGETVEMELEGKRRPIRMLNPELGLINMHDPMPLFIAASGPRARALTAKLGAAWIDNVADVERGAATLEQMRAAWQQAGHARDDAAGGRLDRRRGAGGGRAGRWPARHGARPAPRASMLLHRAADTALAGHPAPLAMRPEFAASVEAYVAHARSFEPTGRLLSVEPPRPSDVRPPRRTPVHHRGNDPPHQLHRHRALT